MGLREIETFQQFDWASAFAALEAVGTPVSDADKESIRSFIANYGTDTSATIAAQQASRRRNIVMFWMSCVRQEMCMRRRST